MKRTLFISGFILSLVVSGCISPQEKDAGMDAIAERYVKLVLEIGRYDADYVDAYYGPESWKPAPLPAGADRRIPAAELTAQADALLAKLEQAAGQASGETAQLRVTYLRKQLTAVKARIALLAGEKLSFDDESRALYDAVAPVHDRAYFEVILAELDAALPGTGALAQRLADYKKAFVIPKDRLDAVFQAAITEARKRTRRHIELPAEENFAIEYVTDKPWSGYNWYKGNSYSLIQINTDLPIYIERAIDLACHEGYPGHHVYNALLEKHLVRERQWIEFSVYPLFSPQSLIAEGSANYGIAMAFPGEERVRFEKEVLFPLAGLDPAKAEKYDRVFELMAKLGYAGNEAARGFLDGRMTRQQAVDWLMKYALMTPERAQQRLRFIEKYRSYVINYNLGQDLVKSYIERNGGTPEHPQRRWQLFRELLSTPRTPSGLQQQ